MVRLWVAAEKEGEERGQFSDEGARAVDGEYRQCDGRL